MVIKNTYIILYLNSLLILPQWIYVASLRLFKFHTIINQLNEILNHDYYLKLSITKRYDKFILLGLKKAAVNVFLYNLSILN